MQELKGDVERQLQYELDTDSAAANNKLKSMQEAAASGDLSTPKAVALMGRVYRMVVESLAEIQEEQLRGAAAVYRRWLRAIPADTAACIAIRECIANCSSEDRKLTKVQNIAERIGRLYELEARIAQAEAVNPMYMEKIHQQIKEHGTTAQRHIRNVYNTAIKRVFKGEIDLDMSRTQMIQLGKFGLDACLRAGLVNKIVSTNSRGMCIDYHLDEDIRKYLLSYTENDVRRVISKDDTRMYCSPEPWSDLCDGGYMTPRRKAVTPLMSLRGVRKSIRERVATEFTAEAMPLVFDTGNYLQSTAYMIHEPTRAAIERVWHSGGGVLGVPRKNAPAAPECPMPRDWVKATATPEELDRFYLWKKAKTRYYDDVRVWRGKVREVGSFLKSSRDLNTPIWFPVFMDSRGRWYYRGVPNPQGSDMAKAVLHFAEKKPLGKRGLFWLKVRIANDYGYDKERMIDRARWTEQNWETICRALDDPENHPDVWGDAPWGMFSAAWELRAALQTGHPEQYCTGIIAHQDATCSGLQHFSALLRDPVGASYVNLVDTQGCGPKQDIYTRVATLAMQSIEADCTSPDQDTRKYAEWWKALGITRAMAKKPVMTYVYKATLRGTTEFLEDLLLHDLHVEFPADEVNSTYKYCNYAAKKLFHGIAMIVPAAAAAMQWLSDVAGDMPRGKPIEWHTPTGMLVVHDYRGCDMRRVKLRSCGVTNVFVKEFTDDTRPLEMRNAIVPNFVHSLDASHLVLTAKRMRADGLSMATIHDSFGSHMCDTDALHMHVRDAFVELYSGNILGSFLWEVGVAGETPMRGDFDLNLVKESEFFFC